MQTTIDTTHVKGQIEALRNQHHRLSGRFLATFVAVPNDKLDWRATPTAKNALEIGAHVAAAHRFFIAALSGEDVPQGFEGAMKWIDDQAAKYQGRDEVVSCLVESRETIDGIYANGINPDAFAASDDYQFLVRLPAFHTETHAGQIDYLQTCWGDQQMYFRYPAE
jgi:hypothetical protein